MSPKPCKIRPGLLVGLAAVILLFPSAGRAEAADHDDLRLVVILTRHGVRSPLQANDRLDAFSAQPWPRWPVAPGVLTAHGSQQMVLLGKYYRERFAGEGLLTARTGDDQAHILFRADNDQRTVASARALAAGLLPGAEPEIVIRPPGEIDPLFRPAQVPVGHPDRSLAVAAVLGRIGGNPARVEEACRPALAVLRRVLYGGDGAPPPGKPAFPGPPTLVQPGRRDHTADLTGTIEVAQQLTDALLLEYAEGLPSSEVGWGRVTPEVLTQLLQLHAVAFDLTAATFYPAQVQASNLASHLLQTLEQAATGRPQPGAFGTPQHRLIVLVGHDTNIVNLGGLLHLNWFIPGTQFDPVLPGGALVFELRRHCDDGRFYVRTYYVTQTLEQMRTLEVLTPENPPAAAPIFIPECSGAGPGFDAPLDRFRALLEHVIDPAFVRPEAP